jgi:hypothetical protein
MSRKVMTPAARARARRRELKREMVRLLKLAEQGLAEFDRLHRPPTDAKRDGVVIEGRIVGDKIITEAEAEPEPRWPAAGSNERGDPA